jgi:L-ascorbate metabolism protein UlaG (beta-lactamase superfamily)
MLKPKLTIPCHYWLTKEHGGDPGEFAECCKRIAPEFEIAIPAIGETIYI